MDIFESAGRRAMPLMPTLTLVSVWILAALLAPLLLTAWQIEPLYASNQNTKYLHALANAGVGYLHEDWLARTKDGLPAFTWLVEAIYRTIGPAGYYIATLGGYYGFLLCALIIYRRVAQPDHVPMQGLAIFIAAIFSFATVEDLQQIVFQGFAEQYVLGGYFQTADFGVLLLLAVVIFEAHSIILACALVLAGATMHPGYVVPGAVLISAFLLYELAYSTRRKKLTAIAICAIGFAGLAAISLALKVHFAPTDPQLHKDAHRILTEIRIPKHASPASWLSMNVALQLAICAAAAWLLPAGRFRFVLRLGTIALVVFVAGALLPTSETYRLVAPWRVSAILLPLSSLAVLAVIVARLHERGYFRPDNARRNLRIACSTIAGCVAIGLGFTIAKFTAPTPAYTDFVRANLVPGQLYLTPMAHIEFRLATGAPQYTTFKSHPYQDVEVLEWHRRLQVARSLYQGARMDCQRLREAARQDRITHVIVEKGRPILDCPFATPIFRGQTSVVFHLAASQL